MTKAEFYEQYEAQHADRRNRICHTIGIPLIVLGILGLLALVRVGFVDLGVLAGIVTLIYFATVSPRGALLSAVAFAILYWIAVHLPWEANAAAFVLGWGFQLAGHRFEGKRPKFLENLVYLLIGPLYFFEASFDAVRRYDGVRR